MLTCLFENGNKARLRHVTVNAIILKDDKILLGKRASNQTKLIQEAGKWALIGGYMDRDENLHEAVQREVFEETGWAIKNLRIFHIKDNPDRPAEDRQNVEFVFLAEADSQKKITTDEVSDLQWFAPNKFPPSQQIAFDHGADLQLYQKYLRQPVPLPIFGNQ